MKRAHDSEAVPMPMAPAAFYILFALADGEKHGYAIMQETMRLSDGQFRMGPATLYTNIQRLLAAEWIKEVVGDDASDSDSRRRYYRLRKPGKLALEQELERMRRVLARAQDLSPAVR